MNRQSLRVQWTQLIVLSGVHFLVDMLGNLLPAILPVLLKEYGITLLVGVSIPIFLSLAANGVQIVTGRMRADKTAPLFLYVGMILAASMCLIALAPRSPTGILLLFVLGVISGTGVAVAHPEGLRGVHTLDGISPALSTAVFMTTGFFGFACGGMISAVLVTSHGLKGLYPLAFCPIVGIVAVIMSRVRLSVERKATPAHGAQPMQESGSVPFWKVLLIGIPAGVSTTILQQLTPTYLHEMGFDLTFGGFSTAVLGWGGAVGPFLWAALAHKRGDLPCSVWAFLLSVPFMVLYLMFDNRPAAAWFLFGVGFSSTSAYVLTVTLAREAKGLNLGHRMALIVGGTWGISMLIYLAFAGVADLVGIGPVLKLTPVGYLLSAVFAYYVLRQHPESVRRLRPVPALGSPSGERASV
jgi:FSR family fosmidomycin resistance protein-like MFS transporter